MGIKAPRGPYQNGESHAAALEAAINAYIRCEQDCETVADAAKAYNVAPSTLCDHVKRWRAANQLGRKQGTAKAKTGPQSDPLPRTVAPGAPADWQPQWPLRHWVSWQQQQQQPGQASDPTQQDQQQQPADQTRHTNPLTTADSQPEPSTLPGLAVKMTGRIITNEEEAALEEAALLYNR